VVAFLHRITSVSGFFMQCMSRATQF